MNKNQREEQRRQEDQALMRGMLWVAGAIVLEGLLFLLNRFAFDYGTDLDSVMLADRLRTVLQALRVAGLAVFALGAVAAVLQLKKREGKLWAGVVSLVGLIVAVCAHISVVYHDSGVRMLYLLVPVLGALALCYYIFPKDFFLCALPAVIAALGLWFVRAGGFGPEVIATVLLCAAVMIAVFKLKKNDGALELAGQSCRFVAEKTNYTMPLASVAVALAAQVVAAVAGGAVAYYLIFAMGAWLFALLVYYTVKML